jgi:hypothetical protein
MKIFFEFTEFTVRTTVDSLVEGDGEDANEDFPRPRTVAVERLSG